MLSIFKSKYHLKNILPDNYVDVHNHLLPGIDDGSKSIEETTTMIEGMRQLNIHSAIATPHTFNGHWDNTSYTIKTAFDIATEQETNKSFLKGYASEYMLDTFLVERGKNEPLLCIYENYIVV